MVSMALRRSIAGRILRLVNGKKPVNKEPGPEEGDEGSQRRRCLCQGNRAGIGNSDDDRPC